MRILKFVILLQFICNFSFGQIPTFNRNYPGVSNFGEGTLRPVEIDSGSCYFSSSGFSLFPVQGGLQRVTKVDDTGEIVIDNLHRDTTRRYYDISSLIKSSDNNLVLLGTRSRAGVFGGNQIFVLKIKPNLTDTIWTYYHQDSSYFDVPVEIVENENGDLGLVSSRGFLGVPETLNAVFLRLNSSGELKAETIIDNEATVGPESIIANDNGGYIISSSAGPSFNNGAFHPNLVFLDSNGVIQSDFSVNSLEQAGMSRYGPDKLILSGYSFPQFTKPKVVMVKDDGSIVFSKLYNLISYTAYNYVGRKVLNGDIVSVGISDSGSNSGFVMRSDSLGNLLWAKQYDFGPATDFLTDFIEARDGGLLVGGACSGGASGQDAWLLKLDANGCLDPQDCEVGVKDMPLPDALTIYPNPANEYLNLKIEQGSGIYTVYLHDATGRLVQHETLSGIGSHTLQVAQLPAGVYFCTVRYANGDFMGTERIVIQP